MARTEKMSSSWYALIVVVGAIVVTVAFIAAAWAIGHLVETLHPLSW